MKKFVGLLGLSLVACTSSQKETREPSSLSSPIPTFPDGTREGPRDSGPQDFRRSRDARNRFGRRGAFDLGRLPPDPRGDHRADRDIDGRREESEDRASCPDLTRIQIGRGTIRVPVQDQMGRRRQITHSSIYTVADLVEKSTRYVSRDRQRQPTFTNNAFEDRRILAKWWDNFSAQNPSLFEAMKDIPTFQKILRYLDMGKDAGLEPYKDYKDYYGGARLTAVMTAALEVLSYPGCFEYVIDRGIKSFENSSIGEHGKQYQSDLESFRKTVVDLRTRKDSPEFERKLEEISGSWEMAHDRYLEARDDFDTRDQDRQTRLADLEDDINYHYSWIVQRLGEKYEYCDKEIYKAGYDVETRKKPADDIKRKIQLCQDRLDREIARMKQFRDDELQYEADRAMLAKEEGGARRASRNSRLEEYQKRLNELLSFKTAFSAENGEYKKLSNRIEQLAKLSDNKAKLESKEYFARYRRAVSQPEDARKRASPDYFMYNLVSQKDFAESRKVPPNEG